MTRRRTKAKPDEEELGRVKEASREAARAAAREAQALDRAEDGPFEAEQARGHVHKSDAIEPHEGRAMADAAFRRGPQKESPIEQTEHPRPRGD
jgi:hypothetical protein